MELGGSRNPMEVCGGRNPMEVRWTSAGAPPPPCSIARERHRRACRAFAGTSYLPDPWNRASVQPRAITGPCGGASALRGQGETGTAGVSADRAPQSPACLVVPAAHEFLVSMCGHRSNETLNMPVEAPERLSGAFRAFTRERYTLGPESPSCALLGAFSGRLGGIAPSTLA